MSRHIMSNVFTSALTEPSSPGDEILAGSPHARMGAFVTTHAIDAGLWEMTPGTAVCDEDDEVFIVLAGDGKLTFADGEMIRLTPGVVVQLASGDRCTWEIRETVRKIYLTPAR